MGAEIKAPKMVKKLSFVIIFIISISLTIFSWGFYVHKEITKQAISFLPDSIQVFYNRNYTEIVSRSIEPDQLKYTNKSEIPKHYIDLENYSGSDFKNKLPSYSDLVAKYGSAKILENGYVPYVVIFYMDSLTIAISKKDDQKIIKFSAYLSHYIGDLNVPLHTTVTYDGDGISKGIHSRFEEKLSEMILKKGFLVDHHAKYITSPADSVFNMLKRSHSFVAEILKSDSLAQYELDIQNLKKKEKFNEEYYQLMNDKIEKIVKDRIRNSSISVADFWFTCWVNASKK